MKFVGWDSLLSVMDTILLPTVFFQGKKTLNVFLIDVRKKVKT